MLIDPNEFEKVHTEMCDANLKILKANGLTVEDFEEALEFSTYINDLIKAISKTIMKVQQKGG